MTMRRRSLGDCRAPPLLEQLQGNGVKGTQTRRRAAWLTRTAFHCTRIRAAAALSACECLRFLLHAAAFFSLQHWKN